MLVLSQFRRRRRRPRRKRIIVNPYDTDEMADGLQRALTMPVEERRERYDALIVRVRTNNVATWRETFLAALSNAAAVGDEIA